MRIKMGPRLAPARPANPSTVPGSAKKAERNI